ncbi:hypothetical protein SLZ27_005575 [Pseudomonas aeruginosa]|nr:hypothetical protein [Pseudomonas aeruginosa]
MLRGAENQERYRNDFEAIQSPETRAAYWLMVGWAATLKDYDVYPGINGYMESLRFYNEGNWNFAVTANQQWLLFYFRKPCFRLAQYSRDEILQRFEGVVERASGELKFHLRNISDVQRLIDYIEK